MQKREYSREFKLMVVRQLENGEKRPAQACREYGLAESVLYRWRNEYKARGEGAFAPAPVLVDATVESRVAELERLCGRLALENDVLKKTLQRAGLRSDRR
jgi:transposase